MRLGIKGKQVFGVTSIVGAVVVVLSLLNLARLGRVSLEESEARADMLAKAVYHRARQVVVEGVDPYAALRSDPGLRSILESALYSKNVTFAAIVDTTQHRRGARGSLVRGAGAPVRTRSADAAGASRARRARRALHRAGAQHRVPPAAARSATREIGSIRIGVSTLLIRQELDASLGPAVATAFSALAVAVLVAMLLAQLLLRPIHVIRSGLTRLGKGEFGVRLDLDQDDEFGELGHVLQHGERAAVGRSIADGRAGGEPRVGGRASRGRRRDREPARRSAVCEPGDARARCRARPSAHR